MTIDNFLRDSAIISRKSCIFDLWSKIGCISEIQRKTCFPLVFRSICTIFAAESVRSCSRSAIDALQRHTLHLQVREASWLSLNRSFVTVITKRKKIMSIDTYKLTSMEEPTDEVLSQLMREAAEEAKQKRAEATVRFFGQLKRESEKIAASC